MDWDDLKVFLHVARTGQVNEAAKQLDLDHSTVSRRIVKLEESVGAALFDRAGRRLRINAAGQSLLSIASRMESLLLNELETVTDHSGSVSGVVRIGAPEGLGAAYLSYHLDELRGGHGNLEVELVALPQNYSLSSREVDIAITLDRPQTGNVATRRLTDYSLGFYASQPYLDQYPEPQTIAELGSHRICGYIPSLLHTGELDYLVAVGIPLFASLRSTSIIAQRAMIETGQAIGILPYFMIGPNMHLKRLLTGGFELKRSYWLSIHEDLRRQSRIRATASALASIIHRDHEAFAGSR